MLKGAYYCWMGSLFCILSNIGILLLTLGGNGPRRPVELLLGDASTFCDIINPSKVLFKPPLKVRVWELDIMVDFVSAMPTLSVFAPVKNLS